MQKVQQMQTSRFTLEKYDGPNSRYLCPDCNSKRSFVRYIDLESGSHLADHVGKCNRELKCGYHYKPKQYFEASGTAHPTAHRPLRTIAPEVRSTSYIENRYLMGSVRENASNNFISYLESIVGHSKAHYCAKLFKIGSALKWRGSTVFWYIDKSDRIRSGKIMLYNSETGKRVKEPFNHVTWVHSELKKKGIISNFNLTQCLFGEHQLMEGFCGSIGIVESEKTAIIATAYLPELTWMACGSLNGLNANKLKAIANFPIILYPDKNAFEKWEAKRNELKNAGFKIAVSNLLESNQFDQGVDIADILPKLPKPKPEIDTLIATNPIVTELIERLDLHLI